MSHKGISAHRPAVLLLVREFISPGKVPDLGRPMGLWDAKLQGVGALHTFPGFPLIEVKLNLPMG